MKMRRVNLQKLYIFHKPPLIIVYANRIIQRHIRGAAKTFLAAEYAYLISSYALASTGSSRNMEYKHLSGLAGVLALVGHHFFSYQRTFHFTYTPFIELIY